MCFILPHWRYEGNGDTTSSFDFAVDGNVVRLNPNFTNTGTCTIAVDGTTKNIRKFDIDTDTYVVLEAGDIKKNNPTELRYDVSEGFFVLKTDNKFFYGTSATPPAGLLDGSLYIQYVD